jgi:hypothetical protein
MKTPIVQYGIFGQAAHDARGNFVVMWGKFRVNTFTTGAQTLPSVATDSVGDFVVARGRMKCP